MDEKKVDVYVITSDRNLYCQNEFIKNHLVWLHGVNRINIFENSYMQDNYYNLKKILFNMRNYITVLRGAFEVKNAKEKIIENRNYTLEFIKNDLQPTHILFLDADILPPLDVIEKLLKHDLDVVSSLCFIMDNQGNPKPAIRFLDNDIKNGNVQKWHFQKPEKPIEVERTGLGCLLIKRECLDKIEKFRSSEDQLDEDYMFSEDLKKVGYKIYLDMQTHAIHHGKGYKI